MDQEKPLTQEESLKLINRMIHEARGYFYETGSAGLIYGFTVLICSLLTYLMGKNIISFPFHPFYILIPVFFVQGYIQFREEKKKKAKTFTDEAIDYVWIGFFLSAMAACCGVWAGLGYIIVSIILILTGFAAFLTGMITRFRYQTVCAFLCWIMGIISFFILNANIFLLLAATAVLIWIIPGFLLRAHLKKQEHGQ